MQILRLVSSVAACLVIGMSPCPVLGGPEIEPVTTAAVTPATGGGDSHYPLVSPDGRYVVFASTANNLASFGSNVPYAARSPAKLDVYLRDRISGTTRLISVNLSGAGGGNGDSLPLGISTNGQYALFESNASDLVEGDTNQVADVFLRDTVSNQTVRVNVSTNGGFANGQSGQSVMTPDARYVAFASKANNLVASDTNSLRDIFVRDLQSGTTVLASPGAKTSGSSDGPLITPDGRYVAFLSSAANLVTGVPQKSEIYVRDLVDGTTSVVSTNAHQFLGANCSACNHSISDDGQYVAFQGVWTTAMNFRYHLPTHSFEVIRSNTVAQLDSWAFRSFHNLDLTPDGRFAAFVAKGSNTNTSQVYLWDGQTLTTTLVSRDLSGNEPTNCVCDYPVVDESGRFVAFLSTATNLTTNAVAAGFHLYVRDLQENTTRLIDANTDGFATGKDFLNAPHFADGVRLIVYDSTDADLATNDNNYAYDVFLHDLATNATELISTRRPNLPSQTPAGIVLDSRTSLSADGRFLAFAAFPGGLLPGSTNAFRNVFVRDLHASSNSLASLSTNGLLAANGMCSSPAISGDARWVAFASLADNLGPTDTNTAQNIFVRDLLSDATSLISVSTNGFSPGNNASSDPIISSNGRYVLFRSRASNLASGVIGTTNRFFVRDLLTATTYLVTSLTPTCATMTPDGRFVAFGGAAGNIYIWDSQLTLPIYTNNTAAISNVAISANGQRVAGLLGSRVYVSDRAAGTNWVLVASSKLTPLSHAGLQFSADGRFLVYTTAEPLVATDTNNVADVYLHDFQAETNRLISRGCNSPVGNASSDSPAISSDGRFVAWRSRASNLVPGDTNSVIDVFLYDRESDATLLLSVSAFGDIPGNDHSGYPVFSDDGQTIVFQSWATDLFDADFNQASDLFIVRLITSTQVVPFVAQIVLPTSGQVALTWPAVWGSAYRVQYRDDLQDGDWLDLNCAITLIGNRGWATDTQAVSAKRFYRVVAN